MNREDVNEWYKHEVLTHPTEYPNLYREEIAKNKWRFEHEART